MKRGAEEWMGGRGKRSRRGERGRGKGEDNGYVPNTQSTQVLKSDGARTQPCPTPEFTGKKLDTSHTTQGSQSQSTGQSIDQNFCKNPVELQKFPE